MLWVVVVVVNDGIAFVWFVAIGVLVGLSRLVHIAWLTYVVYIHVLTYYDRYPTVTPLKEKKRYRSSFTITYPLETQKPNT